MSRTRRRALAALRAVHLLAGLALIGLVYSPIERADEFIAYFRFGWAPLAVLTGLMMWTVRSWKRRQKVGEAAK